VSTFDGCYHIDSSSILFSKSDKHKDEQLRQAALRELSRVAIDNLN
jgi:hypothetical protein